MVGRLGRLVADLVARENAGVTVPNILATRYAGAEIAELWSAGGKVVLERRLWIAVMNEQRASVSIFLIV